MLKYLYIVIKFYLKKIWYFIFGHIGRLSHSNISTYLSCPLKYKFVHIMRFPTKPSPYLAYGSSIHSFLRELHQDYDIKKMTLDKVIKLYEKNFTTTGYKDKDELETYKERGRKLVTRYYNSIKDAELPKIVEFEKYIYSFIEDQIVTGRIDRVDELPDGTYRIIDYKTGLRIPTAEALESDKQANLYWYMSLKSLPKKVKELQFYFLEYDKKILIPYQEKRQEEVKKVVIEVSDGIRKHEFEPHKGPLCGWCDYYNFCPAWSRQRKKFNYYETTIFRRAREEGKMGLSYSKMSMFKNCPRSYKFLYLDRRGIRPKSFFSIGKTVHEAFEHFYTYEGPKKQPTLEELLELYKKSWLADGYKNPEEEKQFYDEGIEWLKNYYQKFIDEKFIKAHIVEEYFELPIGSGHVMIGFVDRIQKNPDGSFELFDYKTDPKMRTQQEVDNDLQLTIYYWAARESMDIELSSLTLLFLRFNDKVTTTRTEKDIHKFVSEVDKTASEMIEKQVKLIEFYKEILSKFNIYPEISKNYTITDLQKVSPLINSLLLENPDKEKTIKEMLKESVNIFPPNINKYCGGCDFLDECPLKEKIITEYRDKVMNLEEDVIKEEEKESAVESSTTPEKKE